MVEMEI